MQLPPIILFTYRRIPRKTLKSLLANKEAKKSEFFIFSDGYKSEIDKQDVLEVRKYLKTIKGFKKVTIIERDKNWGLAENIINGVSEVINKYGKVIVLEDDLIVSDDFLEYMNEALEFYKDDEKIWSISGYTPSLKSLKNYNKDVYLSLRANPWGWATWENRWNKVDWEIKDWKEFRKNKEAIKQFNLSGNDMFKMLEVQMLGKIDSWAIRWCYNQFKQNSYTIYPVCSKIQNIGFDNVGTHNNTGSGFDKWNSGLCNKKLRIEKVVLDDNIIDEFKKFHNLSLKTKIGYFLRKYGGYKFAKKLVKLFE